jgi:hypothetical protein
MLNLNGIQLLMQWVFIIFVPVLFISSNGMGQNASNCPRPEANRRGHDLKSGSTWKRQNCLMEMWESLLNWGLGTLFSPLKM